MLVSHSHKFIFFKTIKTASTSIEVFFEPYCTDQPSDYRDGEEFIDEHISNVGIVGARRAFGADDRPTFFNHQSASEIAGLLPNEFANYFKFTCVRNPFDMLISKFWWDHQNVEIPESEALSAFRSWVLEQTNNFNTDIYLIEGQCAVDYFIRFESLKTDVECVATKLGIDSDIENLGMFKSKVRKTITNLVTTSDYYDEATYQHVRKLFAWEIENFGYEID